MNADLKRERETGRRNFDVERLTHMLDGGSAEATRRRRQLQAMIERDPTGVFDNSDNMYLHRTERHVRALAKHVRLIELCRKVGIGSEPEANGDVVQSPDFPTLIHALADDLPTALHWVMFVPNIQSLCDEEQQSLLLPLCRDWRMIGCYAQTELGHGSNVRALETTATFLPERKGGMKGGSFVIHSPTITSAKFWPGTLGRTANHAMVIARLIDGDGVDRGIHNFLVPLRSMKDHTLLPGVTTGDIGPKIGYPVMDNGFAMFDKVVIPRRNMAMRFASVDSNGKYEKKAVSDAVSKIAYITMMQVRILECFCKAIVVRVRNELVPPLAKVLVTRELDQWLSLAIHSSFSLMIDHLFSFFGFFLGPRLYLQRSGKESGHCLYHCNPILGDSTPRIRRQWLQQERITDFGLQATTASALSITRCILLFLLYRQEGS